MQKKNKETATVMSLSDWNFVEPPSCAGGRLRSGHVLKIPTPLVAPAVESSIAVEDAVENRVLYRVFVSRLFQRGFGHYSATIARLSPPSGLERGG